MYNLTYSIPATRHQRGNKQTLKNLDKETARNWCHWLESKVNADYKLTKI